MEVKYKMILWCCLTIMRLCVKLIKKDCDNEMRFSWLENNITDLERIVRDKL